MTAYTIPQFSTGILTPNLVDALNQVVAQVNKAIATVEVDIGTNVNITSGQINGTHIGNVTPSDGTFSTLAISGFTNGSIPFFDTSVTPTFNQDNNNLFWNKASHILSVNTGGDQTGTDSISTYNQCDTFLPVGSFGAITTTGATPQFTASYARGTGASPTSVLAGDGGAGFSVWPYGTTRGYYPSVAALGFTTGSTANDLGGELRLYTKADGGALTQRFTISNTGVCTIANLGLGIVHADASGNLTSSTVSTGDITNNAVTYAKIQQGSAYTILGVTGGSAANYAEISSSTAGAILCQNSAGTSVAFRNTIDNVAIGNTIPASGTFSSVGVTTSATPTNGFNLPSANTLGFLANGALQLQIPGVASAVNYFTIAGSTSSNNINFSAAGTATNLSIQYNAKGSGGHSFYTGGGLQFQILDNSSAANYITVTGASTGNAPAISAQGNGDLIIYTAGTKDIHFLTNNTSTDVLRIQNAGTLKFTNSASFSANNTVATVLGSLGPTGSHTTVQTWLTIVDNGGNTRYIPCF